MADVPQQPTVRAKGKSAKRNEAKRKKKEEEQLQQVDGILASETAEMRWKHFQNASPCHQVYSLSEQNKLFITSPPMMVSG